MEVSCDINQDGKREHDRGKAVKATASEVNSLAAGYRDDDNGIHSQSAQVTAVKAVTEKIVKVKF